jgi:16S rRNA C967 or C1407 C5-methylase (RsmB/RsmF family)/NOL1/NOP2/fmu family ribosome biogenesis protein
VARSGRRTRRRDHQPVDAGEIPSLFRERMAALLGAAESERLLAAMPRTEAGLRVNTLRRSVPEALELIGEPLEPLAFPPEGFRVPGDSRPGRSPLHAAGLFYLQDPAAMAVGALMDPRPGALVADLAAAPGGKSTHLAARMENRGFLLANDVHPGRARELAGNLERLGVRNAAVTIEEVPRLAARLPRVFDHVLLDAPCSGEAMFCESEAARRSWSPAAVQGCARRQVELLVAAAAMVAPGGRLVYSTCTFSPEEDEQVVAAFLRANPVFELVPAARVPGARPGHPAWGGEPLLPELRHTVRLWPHQAAGAGHFIAILQRTGGDRVQPVNSPESPAAASGDPAARLFQAFADETLVAPHPGEGELVRQGDELFLRPAPAPPLGGIRTLRPGLWLGGVGRGRFEPAHALAMALRPDQAVRQIDLADDPSAAHAYLRGEVLRTGEGEDGWTLVTLHGLPLGWAKRVGTALKNHLPRGLRTLSS